MFCSRLLGKKPLDLGFAQQGFVSRGGTHGYSECTTPSRIPSHLSWPAGRDADSSRLHGIGRNRSFRMVVRFGLLTSLYPIVSTRDLNVCACSRSIRAGPFTPICGAPGATSTQSGGSAFQSLRSADAGIRERPMPSCKIFVW